MDTLKVTYTDNTMNNSYMATLRESERQKGRTIMIYAMYNYRQGEIHYAEFSDEFNKPCIPFENSLSETAADESCIQKGFKDGMSLMKEILE